MVFPLIAAGVAAAASIAGGMIASSGAQAAGAAQAKGAYMRGQAEADSLRYDALVDEYNANIAIRDRALVLQQIAAAGRDLRVKSRAEQGQIRAAYGWSGLALEGSPLDVLEATALEQSLDFRKLLYQGEVQAAGLTDRENMLKAHAYMLRTKANNAVIGAGVAAEAAQSAAGYQSAAAILGAVGSAASTVGNMALAYGRGGGGTGGSGTVF